MIPRSAAFDAAITRGARVFVDAELYRKGAAIGKINLTPGAKVHLDETSAARRTFNGQVADSGGLTPHLYTDPLAPFGVELMVFVGVTYNDGSTERVPAGVFRLQVAQSSSGQVTLTGVDRSMVIANNLNQQPYTIAPSTPLDTAIQTYLLSKYPNLPFVADSAAHTTYTPPTPTVYLEGTKTGDPWKNMQDLAAANGRELYFDATGQAVLRVVPTPISAPIVWNYSSLRPDNLHLGAVHTMDTTNVKNVWVVEGAGSWFTFAGQLVGPTSYTISVTDPTSPIYPDPQGFGVRPDVVSTSQAGTIDQVQAMATGLAMAGAQGADQVTFKAVPHPAHEPGDVVHFLSTLMQLDLPVVLSSWEFQLDCLAENNYVTRLVPPFINLSEFNPTGQKPPPGVQTYWILGDPSYSQLGQTTFLY